MRAVILMAILGPSGAWADSTMRQECIDDTDVVGFRRCPDYGEWGANLLDPYVFVDFGMNRRHFVSASRPAIAARTTTGMAAKSSGSTDALTFDERVGFRISHNLYLAFDFELGNFEVDDSDPSTHDVILAGFGAIGYRADMHLGVLSAEIAGGGMEYSYPTDTSMHKQALVEARIHADIWLSPWCTLGGMVGTNLLEKGDWMAGLYFGFHSYAFAGDR
jgi:hypothetical protein